ncbi:Golgi SNAP receptor complex member 2 [Chionoecetes opilio]|uniref:Golgi SNAP receptor complex member 2 n=1 Tax=Chionoecetes opilio TaxID=41210 RepID=A0A8J5CRX9_CHIOP|nr:Golgi SNAP receptor complex member 2 [Chionoecetes opilio]
MEGLYHHTNRLLQEVTSQDLLRIQRTPPHDDAVEAEGVVVHKLDTIHANCNRLDILINKEPAARRANAKYRVDQLKYDLKHVQNSFAMLQHQKQVRVREADEREALLSRKFTTNDQQDTSIFLDHELQHHGKLGEANRNVDEMLGAGMSILQSMRDQGTVLKGARRRVLDLANTLGLSNTVMRLIEHRSTQDKYILFGGMVFVLLCLYLLLRYL